MSEPDANIEIRASDFEQSESDLDQSELDHSPPAEFDDEQPVAPIGPIDWTVFNEDWARFHIFATDAENPRREWLAWATTDTGNALKVRKTVEILLERLHVCGWGSVPTMAWMADWANFDQVFLDHSKYLKDVRRNQDNARAQQLRNLKRPLAWAVAQSWPDPEEPSIDGYWSLPAAGQAEVVAWFEALCAQVSNRGTADYKRRREGSMGASQIDQPELHALVDALEATVLASATDTTEDKLAIAECAVAVLHTRAPRAIELYKLHFADTVAEADYFVKEELMPHGGSVLIRHDHGSYRSYEIYVPAVKGHVNRQATNHDALLDLLFKSTPMATGELIFTPNMHGLRACKARDQHQFDSATWSDYIKGMTQRRFGVALRPTEMRRIRSTHTTRFASEEVLNSTAAAMATSARRLDDTYSQKPMSERTWLSTQVSKFEFDPRFVGDSATVTVPTPRLIGMSSHMAAFVPARLVRMEGDASVYALYEFSPLGDAQLSSKMYRLDAGMRAMSGGAPSKLVLDPATASQRWRHGRFAAARSESIFEDAGISTREWADRATVAGDLGLRAGDMVYSLAHFAIAEVKATQGTKVRVLVASETSCWGETNSRQAHYRFEHAAKAVWIDIKGAVFPIDLSFVPSVGVFIHRLSSNLETV